MSIECTARLEGDGNSLLAAWVRDWVETLPEGAVLTAITKDFGTQRDPDERLVGLRADWSENR